MMLHLGRRVPSTVNDINEIGNIVSKPIVYAQVACCVLLCGVTLLRQIVLLGDTEHSWTLFDLVPIASIIVLAVTAFLGYKSFQNNEPNTTDTLMYINSCGGTLAFLSMSFASIWVNDAHSMDIPQYILCGLYIITGGITLIAFLRGKIFGRRLLRSRNNTVFPATVSDGYSNMPASNDGSPTMNRGGPAPAPTYPPYTQQYGFQPTSETSSSLPGYSQFPTQRWT